MKKFLMSLSLFASVAMVAACGNNSTGLKDQKEESSPAEVDENLFPTVGYDEPTVLTINAFGKDGQKQESVEFEFELGKNLEEIIKENQDIISSNWDGSFITEFGSVKAGDSWGCDYLEFWHNDVFSDVYVGGYIPAANDKIDFKYAMWKNCMVPSWGFKGELSKVNETASTVVIAEVKQDESGLYLIDNKGTDTREMGANVFIDSKNTGIQLNTTYSLSLYGYGTDSVHTISLGKIECYTGFTPCTFEDGVDYQEISAWGEIKNSAAIKFDATAGCLYASVQDYTGILPLDSSWMGRIYFPELTELTDANVALFDELVKSNGTPSVVANGLNLFKVGTKYQYASYFVDGKINLKKGRM